MNYCFWMNILTTLTLVDCSIGAVLCSRIIVKRMFNVMTLWYSSRIFRQYTFMISYPYSLLIDLHDLHTADIIPPPIFMKVISCSIPAILSFFVLLSCISSFLFVDTVWRHVHSYGMRSCLKLFCMRTWMDFLCLHWYKLYIIST